MIYALTLTWNNCEKLQNLYNSLIEVRKFTDLKWFVRDNNSQDETEEFAKTMNPEFVYYYKYKNNDESFSQGNNFLFNKAKEAGLGGDDFILLLNDDIIFKNPESLKNMLSLMTERVAIVGTRLLFPDGHLQHAGVVFVENDKGRFPHNYRSGEPDDSIAQMNREFQAVTGACMLIRAKYIHSVLLDTNYIWGYEDVDLALRMVAKKKRVLYCGNTHIIHDESSSLNKNPQNKKFFFKNLAYFNRQWAGKFDVDIEKYRKNQLYRAL